VDGTVSSAAPRARLPWVDVAKGACIILVVLLHVTNKHLVRLDDADLQIRDTWVSLGQWLRPVRMPLFFLLSGLLAGPALQRRRPAEIRRRVTRSYELYVVWLVLQSFLVDRRLRPGVTTTTLDGFVGALVLPAGSLWYLWALAVYVVALAAVPARWRGPALVGFGVVWILVSTKQWHLAPRPRDLVQYLAWFALGAYVPATVRGAVAWANGRRTLLAVAAYVAALVWLRDRGPHLAPLFQIVGVLAGLAVAARARGRIAGVLAALGRRTLSIYVLHVPLLTIWSHVLREHGWRGASPVGWLLWGYPVVLAAGLIATALCVEDALRRVGAGRLFGDRSRAASPSRPADGPPMIAPSERASAAST
jgi:uncharacterized membrane protein YcfT